MNCDYEFILPLVVQIGGKKSRFSVDVNHFVLRNRWDYGKAKKKYCEHMREQLEGFDMIEGQIHIHYEYFNGKDNSPDLDNFVGGAKKFFQDAMVHHGLIEDDNINFITSSSEEYRGLDRENPRIVASITVKQ